MLVYHFLLSVGNIFGMHFYCNYMILTVIIHIEKKF